MKFSINVIERRERETGRGGGLGERERKEVIDGKKNNDDYRELGQEGRERRKKLMMINGSWRRR